MSKTMAERGKAMIFPTLHLRGGVVQRHARWDHGAAYFAGTPADVTQRFLADGCRRIHVLCDDGPTAENRRALAALTAASAVPIVEGGLCDVATCLALIDEGHKLLIVEPAVMDDVANLPILAAQGAGPLIAVGGTNELVALLPRLWEALAGCFVGMVYDLGYPVDVEVLSQLRTAVDRFEGELMVRGMPGTDAGPMQKQLHPLGQLDLTSLVDGEFLVEMARFNRRAKDIDWAQAMNSPEHAADKFLVETVLFIAKQSIQEKQQTK